jgi:hypothetical protein
MKIARTIRIWVAGLLGCFLKGSLSDPLFPHPINDLGMPLAGYPLLFVCFRLCR